MTPTPTSGFLETIQTACSLNGFPIIAGVFIFLIVVLKIISRKSKKQQGENYINDNESSNNKVDVEDGESEVQNEQKTVQNFPAKTEGQEVESSKIFAQDNDNATPFKNLNVKSNCQTMSMWKRFAKWFKEN